MKFYTVQKEYKLDMVLSRAYKVFFFKVKPVKDWACDWVNRNDVFKLQRLQGLKYCESEILKDDTFSFQC